MKRGYARVSTDDQNAELQINALEAAGCDKIYVDQGVSGTKRTRPELDRLLSDMKAGDTVVIWKLDRLGRSVQLIIALVDQMRLSGVDFRSLSDNIDTTTPAGKMQFHIFAAFAEFERDLISERTKAGLEAARKRGAQIGRPRIPADVPASRTTEWRRRKREAEKN